MSFQGLLNTSCNIQKIINAQDSTTGELEKTWANIYTGVKCRLDQASGQEFASPNSILARATHILFMDKKYTLKEGTYRIVTGGNNYNILLVSDGGGHGHHLELTLQLIQ